MKKRILVTLLLPALISAVFLGCDKKSYFESHKDEGIKMEKSAVMTESSDVESEEPSGAQGATVAPNVPQEVVVKVYVYNEADGVKVSVDGAGAVDAGGLVDINSATKDELMTLSGIGSGKADAIISYRDQHGAFSSAEDIKNVDGIGDGTFEKIKDKITV